MILTDMTLKEQNIDETTISKRKSIPNPFSN